MAEIAHVCLQKRYVASPLLPIWGQSDGKSKGFNGGLDVHMPRPTMCLINQ
jgi:hypothetical protein